MDAVIKWVGRTLVTAVIWVFLLSITWDGRPLFSYANEILVQNSVVEAVDSKLAEVWERVTDSASATMDGDRQQDKM